MIQQQSFNAVAFAVIILVAGEVAMFNPAMAQEATTAPATAAPATTEPATTVPAVAAPAPAAPAASAEPAAAPTSPPISADIITPDVIKDMRERIVQPVTIMSILAANKVHTGIDQGAIDKMDEAWKTEAKSDDQPFIAEILSSPLSNYLLYIQASSAGLFTEIFVMDKFGLNVGQSSVTSDYWQGDEDKYQKTFAVGPDAVFVDEPEFDDKTKTWRTQVDFTVVDPETNQSIGAVTVEFNLTELQRRLQS
ncbi:hypothetical protein [Dongia sp.]|uniref:hypothetical protein n=1 Tax=Dongia sp. TaxID=1977262 RepID=UPI0035B4A008